MLPQSEERIKQALLVFVIIFIGTTATTKDNMENGPPNYITEKEFAAIRGLSVPITTSGLLPLPRSSDQITTIQPRSGFGRDLWTNGTVPYILDPNFTPEQRQQVALAIKAYHDNTCIRFVPKQESDIDYVNIQYDNSEDVCGISQICKNGGEQYAKVGGNCVVAGTIMHELGHSLCAGHEMSRMDRDKWIGFNTSICTPPPKDDDYFNLGLNKLYDYLSIEHYEVECYTGCYLPKQENVIRCGSGRLSVLDIEVFNEIYNCTSGCLGYRYVNSRNALSNPVVAGTDVDNSFLYSCRAYWQGDIIPGKYQPSTKECFLPWNGAENKVTGDFIEVLTNPNDANFQWIKSNSLPSNAIRGGRSNLRETLYVITCWYNINGTFRFIPGKYQPSKGAFTSLMGSEIPCAKDTYYFLVCSDDA